MDKKSILKKIGSLYQNENTNIIQYVQNMSEDGHKRSVEDIMISYDFQAGSYTAEYEKDPGKVDVFVKRLADTIDSLDCDKQSILDCGTGEATTFVPLLKKLKTKFDMNYGIDISWSRLKAAERLTKNWGGERY